MYISWFFASEVEANAGRARTMAEHKRPVRKSHGWACSALLESRKSIIFIVSDLEIHTTTIEHIAVRVNIIQAEGMYDI